MKVSPIALLGALLLMFGGCGEKAAVNKAGDIDPVSPTKSDVRSEVIRNLEVRAMQSDADAQLSLAKILLDGNVTPPDYERAKGLFAGASQKELPEALLGLIFLKNWKLVDDDSLPNSNTLKSQALTTRDSFVTAFLLTPDPWFDFTPSEQLIKLAESGYPLANAKLAKYYGVIASRVVYCQRVVVINKAVKMRQSASELDKCSHWAQIPDSFRHAIAYAAKILDTKEVDADKVRYWSLLGRRVATSRPNAPEGSSLDPLSQMQVDYVLNKADPYFSVFADALSQVGMLLKDGNNKSSNFTQAAQLLKKAAELGSAEAQNALGELYQAGRGVPKDFEMAARYFAQSAQQGDASGAKNIGLALARGQGVEQNQTQAYFWLSIGALGSISQYLEMDARALDQLDPFDPAVVRDRLAQSMRSEEVAEAQRLTREWRPSYQVGPPPVIAASRSGSNSATGSVSAKNSTGTGFIVSEAGHLMTNHHVIDGCTNVKIAGREGEVKVITSDTVNDLALLQLLSKTEDYASISPDPSKLRQGEDVVVFGYPLNFVLSSGGNLTLGTISALTGLGNNTNQTQITAPIQPGSSGSPVMDKKGSVVGLVSMKLSDSKMAQTTGQVGQNVNFAVNGQTVKAFLDANNVQYKTGGGFFSREKSNADIAEAARKWTVMVECWR